jgi:hypothetical protein
MGDFLQFSFRTSGTQNKPLAPFTPKEYCNYLVRLGKRFSLLFRQPGRLPKIVQRGWRTILSILLVTLFARACSTSDQAVFSGDEAILSLWPANRKLDRNGVGRSRMAHGRVTRYPLKCAPKLPGCPVVEVPRLGHSSACPGTGRLVGGVIQQQFLQRRFRPLSV